MIQPHLSDGDTFNHNGYTFRVHFPYDESHGSPWTETDGHGIVSEMTSRAKRPGERVLFEDRSHRLYYDVKATMQIAVRDGWGTQDGKREGETKRQYAARAVEADYAFLQGWCRNDWHYVGVVVSHGTNHESLWGIESLAGAYLDTVARELADQMIDGLEQTALQTRVEYGASYGCSL